MRKKISRKQSKKIKNEIKKIKKNHEKIKINLAKSEKKIKKNQENINQIKNLVRSFSSYSPLGLFLRRTMI